MLQQVRALPRLLSPFSLLKLSVLSVKVAAKILEHFGPSTKALHLSFNPDLGSKGLRDLVQGMVNRKDSVWELRMLELHNGGLGETSELSFCVVSR